MGNRRQPSKQFLRRFKGYGKPVAEVPEKRPSWIQRFRNSDWWLWAEVIGFFSVLAALYAFWLDLEDRQTQRITQAWQLVTQPAPGNSGKGPALEYLNSQGIQLVGINLSAESNQGPSHLVEVNLPGAGLMEANLSGAVLGMADLSGANLWDADLSGAYLSNADLSDANLWDADLSDALLWGAKQLDQSQLDQTCGDETTILPEGLTIKACSRNR